tara:strand:+ start:230 stop:622 length:393 start_codon:yes stop_codon:yes gene_type:complete
MSLFGVGAGEAALVLVLAMIVVGPQRFPEIARQGGRWYRLARQYTDEVMKDVRAAVQDIEDEIKEETKDFDAIEADLHEIRDDLEDVREEPTSHDTKSTDLEENLASSEETPADKTAETSIRPSRRTEDS